MNDDHLMEQLANELRPTLQELNKKYDGFYHMSLVTLCDLNDQCEKCQMLPGQRCLRVAIGYECKHDDSPINVESTVLINNTCTHKRTLPSRMPCEWCENNNER